MGARNERVVASSLAQRGGFCIVRVCRWPRLRHHCGVGEFAPGLAYIVGYISAPVGAILSPIFVVRMALKKRYGDFHIALVPVTMEYRHDVYDAQEAAQRFEHHPGYR